MTQLNGAMYGLIGALMICLMLVPAYGAGAEEGGSGANDEAEQDAASGIETGEKLEIPNDNPWEFELTPYMWFTWKDETMGIRNRLEADLDTTPMDILEDLKMGALLHFEGHKNRWGVFTDVVYMQIGDSTRTSLRSGIPGGLLETLTRMRGVKVDADAIQAIVEVGPMYRLGNEDQYLDLMLGVRYGLLDVEVGLGPLDIDRDRDWFEPFIGGRYRRRLSDKWGFSFRGDVGGFGVGSEFAATAVLLFGYEMSPRTVFGFGVRYLYFDYDHDGFAYESHTVGPMAGVTFRF